MIPRFSPEIEARILAGVAADQTYPAIAAGLRAAGMEVSSKSISKVVRRAATATVKKEATSVPVMSTTQQDVESMVQSFLDRLWATTGGIAPRLAPESVAVADPVVEIAPTVRIPDQNRGSRLLDFSDRQFERVAWLADLHHPFHDKAALSVAFQALKDYRPQLIILGGDYYDCYSISSHDKEPGRADFVQDEFDAAIETHKQIQELARDSTVVFIQGNHEERLERMKRSNPGLFKLRSLDFPVAAGLPKEWIYMPNQGRLKLGALSAIHGDLRGRGNSVMHAAAGMLNKLRTSVIFGHFHRFQSFFATGETGEVRGGYAIGHLSNVNEAKYITSPDWQSGFATIDFDWSAGVFAVSPHMIIRDVLRWGGHSYLPA